VDVSDTVKKFNFAQARPRMGLGSGAAAENSSKALFLAQRWNWVTELEGASRPSKLLVAMNGYAAKY